MDIELLKYITKIGIDNNIMIYDGDAFIGQFTKKLINLTKDYFRINLCSKPKTIILYEDDLDEFINKYSQYNVNFSKLITGSASIYGLKASTFNKEEKESLLYDYFNKMNCSLSPEDDSLAIMIGNCKCGEIKKIFKTDYNECVFLCDKCKDSSTPDIILMSY